MKPISGAPISYELALRAQEALVALRRDDRLPDTLWVLEHRPVITFGTSGGEDHLLLAKGEIARRGFEIHPTRRGGDVTCHEPGQLVGYPIVSLDAPEDRDLHEYLRRIEGALIAALATWDLEADRVAGRTGVWLDVRRQPKKIAAIGVRCAGWITSHGFALNVTNSLEGFRLIVPCGISDAGVTRLLDVVPPDRLPSMEDVARTIHRELERALDRPLALLRGEEALDRAGLSREDEPRMPAPKI